MKTFTLHLIVLLIAEVHYCRIVASSSSSLPAASTNYNTSHTDVRFQLAKTKPTIAGNLQHATQRPINDSNSPNYLSKIYFRRKTNKTDNIIQNQFTTKSSRIETNILSSHNKNREDGYDDAALLEDLQDTSNWDDGILRLSAGSGKESFFKSKKKDESKKTLSDQVKEGKYGLIEDELFKDRPKRPGIISYLPNKEVPEDNSKNYGGLNEDDIWLAEDHLLVIKGGRLNSKNIQEPWQPIDNYEAPKRQIKISSNPKIPPPFPVQFEDDGPIQFIGNSKLPLINPFSNESISILASKSHISSDNVNNNEKNILTWKGSSENITKNQNGYYYPSPSIGWPQNNETILNQFNQIDVNFNKSFNNLNDTDYIDEDDPSLYYPPAYSFVYKNNYSSPVPPGPLVPGIVLPPPPNSFGRLEETNSSKPKEPPYRQIIRKNPYYRPKVTASVSTTKLTTTTTTTPRSPIYIRHKPTLLPKRIPTYQVFREKVVQTTKSPSKDSHDVPHPEIISFIPKIPVSADSLSKGSPIYYEYFDARKQTDQNIVYDYQQNLTPNPSNQQYNDHSHMTSTKPIFKEVVTRLIPQRPQKASKSYNPTKLYPYNDYLYITPKPEIKPNGISDNFIPISSNHPVKPIENFDREVDAIRNTLQYFKNQHLQQSPTPKISKGKPVYEYSFNAKIPTSKPETTFSNPIQYDEEPFKPMVQYSQPMNKIDGFRAIIISSKKQSLPSQSQFYSTSSPITNYEAQTFSHPIVYATTSQPNEETNLETTTRNVQNSPSWISIEKQLLENMPHNNRVVLGYSRNLNSNHDSINGYVYASPLNLPKTQKYYHYEQNDDFSKNINEIRAQIGHFKQKQPLSLENDTYINYTPGRRLNPNAEFIKYNKRIPYHHRLQYHQGNQQHLSPVRISSYKPIYLGRDTLVNYKIPLPRINPDSEYVQPEIFNRNIAYGSQNNNQARPYYMPARDVLYRNN